VFVIALEVDVLATLDCVRPIDLVIQGATGVVVVAADYDREWISFAGYRLRNGAQPRGLHYGWAGCRRPTGRL